MTALDLIIANELDKIETIFVHINRIYPLDSPEEALQKAIAIYLKRGNDIKE